MRNKICILYLVLTAFSFTIVGCTNAKETSKQTDGVAADTTTGSTTEYDTTENETTTAKKVWKEQQVLSGAKRIDVGADMNNLLIGFHCIPSFCVWDDEFGGYIANNNDTNTNGESFKVKVIYEAIDKSEIYEDKKLEVSNMIENIKSSCWTSDFRYMDELQAFSYLYATDETIQTENGNMVHTVATLELRRYNRENMANNYTSLKFEVDILKPEELTENSVVAYISALYQSVIPGSNGESLK